MPVETAYLSLILWLQSKNHFLQQPNIVELVTGFHLNANLFLQIFCGTKCSDEKGALSIQTQPKHSEIVLWLRMTFDKSVWCWVDAELEVYRGWEAGTGFLPCTEDPAIPGIGRTVGLTRDTGGGEIVYGGEMLGGLYWGGVGLSLPSQPPIFHSKRKKRWNWLEGRPYTPGHWLTLFSNSDQKCGVIWKSSFCLLVWPKVCQKRSCVIDSWKQQLHCNEQQPHNVVYIANLEGKCRLSAVGTLSV